MGDGEIVIQVCDVFFKGKCDRCDHPCDDYLTMGGYSDGDEEEAEFDSQDDEDYEADEDYEDDPDWDELVDDQLLADESESDDDDA